MAKKKAAPKDEEKSPLDQTIGEELGHEAPEEGDGTGVPEPPAEDEPTGKLPAKRPGSKLARGIVNWTRDSLDRNLPKIESFQGRAEASPDAAASSLEEMGQLLRNMAHSFETRAAILRHGPGEPNPVFQVTAKHVKGELIDAAAALETGASQPSAWKNAQTRAKEALRVIGLMEGILLVEGVSLIATEQEGLFGPDGEPIKKGA